MSKNNYTIEIHISRLNNILKEMLNVPFNGCNPGQGDTIKYTRQKITIKGVRSNKYKPQDILRNKQNSLYSQIYKSILYLYLKNERKINISEITIKRSTTKTADEPYRQKLDLYSQPVSNDFSLGVTIPEVVLALIFEENESANSLRMAVSHWLRGLSAKDRYFKFERYWRTFERLSIYHIRTAPKITDFEAMCQMRDFILVNNAAFVRTLPYANGISGLKLRSLGWDEYVESEFPEATTAKPRQRCYESFKNNFVIANHDIRIMAMLSRIVLPLRTSSLTLNGYLVDVQNHIAAQIAARIKSNDELSAMILCRYAYYLRNKMFHAEKSDFTFTFTDKTIDDNRIDLINDLFDRCLKDIILVYNTL